jgi:hypothetical protein
MASVLTSRETIYKVCELNIVTDESIEYLLNLMIPEGWIFDSIHFVNRESSRRPSMAFVFFVRMKTAGEEIEIAGNPGDPAESSSPKQTTSSSVAPLFSDSVEKGSKKRKKLP